MERGPSHLGRLIEQDDDVGHLLRAADGEFRQGLDEPHAFRELEQRRRNRACTLTSFLADLVGWLVGWTLARKN